MKTRPGRILGWFVPTVVVVVLLGPFVHAIISIELRLWKNGAVATRLVETLGSKFPEAQFHGAASYESEIVYISAGYNLDPEERSKIEQCLRMLKADQEIAPSIWIRFLENTVKETVEIRI